MRTTNTPFFELKSESFYASQLNMSNGPFFVYLGVEKERAYLDIQNTWIYFQKGKLS